MNQNPFMNDTYFKEVCNSHFKEIECKPFMLRSANENSLGEMSIPEPMIIDARQDMDENEYRACSMLVNVCKHMIQKTLTDTAEKNNIDAAKALKDMDLWVKGFVDFPLPFFTFESMQEQEYKNDDFCLSANADVIEQIVNIDGVPSLKRAVISALKSSGEKGNIASYSNTEKSFSYFGLITGYEQKQISMRLVSFTMNMKNTNVSSLCGMVEKTHLDSTYRTYHFTADKALMMAMQKNMEGKIIEVVSKYLLDFIEVFYGEQMERYKKMLDELINK